MKRLIFIFTALISFSVHAAKLPAQWQIADKDLADYFARETRVLSEKCLGNIQSADDWKQHAPEYRAQLAEMLGLSPMPERTDLHATITKRFDADAFTVENLHFQSRPGLYVTANLYLPKNLTKPAPTVLYVCGHGPFITNGISYGTKVSYQHWGSWFARNGYICMIIDTLESGEILGEHHGTYRAGMWWWNSRGYTPGGVECWNGMRALDYLSTRPEVDTNRFAVTGRSGGGAYSWFITAMDDRIKCAAPTAGITDLENYVVDGAVEGHCDCMFFVNTHRWDYPQLAALAAPRPLLICNTDDDNIFPLDGVVRLRNKVRRIYELLGRGTNCGLVITPGPHKDTQELQVPVMRWFNRYLKGDEPLIETAAMKLFSPEQLKVFDTLPGDAINAKIHETFVKAAHAEVPKTKEEWAKQRQPWLALLRQKCFHAWPENAETAVLSEQSRTDWKELNRGLAKLDAKNAGTFEQSGRADWPTVVHYTLKTAASGRSPRIDVEVPRHPNRLDMNVFSSTEGISIESKINSNGARIWLNLPPLATGATQADAKKEVQLRRRFMLLGTTAEAMRVQEIMSAIAALRAKSEFAQLPIRLEAEGDMAVNALYASLFAPVDELVLTNLPKSHMNGPDYLNVLRILDIPQAVAMVSERGRVELRGANEADWQYPIQTAKNFGWEKNLRVVP